MLRATAIGANKRVGEGLTFLPRATWSVVSDVLEESGLRGLVVLIAVCGLQGAEIPRCRLDGDDVTYWQNFIVHRWPLDPDSANLVRATLATLSRAREEKPTIRLETQVANLLHDKVTKEVRKRLTQSGIVWAEHVNVSVTTLRALGVEVALRRYRDRREFLRAYRRTAYAHPEDIENPSSEETMTLFDNAVAPFWERVGELLSLETRSAIAALSSQATDEGSYHHSSAHGSRGEDPRDK